MSWQDEEHLPPPEGPAGDALQEALRALKAGGQGLLPQIAGVPPLALARWLYRGWLLQEGDWRPFIHVDPLHLVGAPESDPAWWADLAPGMVYLGETPLVRLPRAFTVGRTPGLALLVQGGWVPLTAPQAWVNRLLRLDASHGVAVDPGLTFLRRSLLSHCRGLSPVHLTGEPGTEKVALARFAHAALDDRGLSVVRGDAGRPEPGEWVLFEEVTELGGASRAVLAEKLASLEPPTVASPRRSPWPRPRRPELDAIVGESAALAEALDRVVRLAPRMLPVLILGEPGAGKEGAARALHALSGRPGPLVALDMGAVPEALAESELFGHRRGSFTGADRNRPGAFRAADGGTLFLDEIGSASPALQGKLLRVLQEGAVQPVGEDRAVPVDVRVVAATNADLQGMVRAGRFRADLLDRLSGAVISLPPLRERLEDLDLLARHFLREALGGDAPDPWCTPAARALLLAHRWPGNIRELANLLRFAAAFAPPGVPIDAEHLGPLSPRLARRVPVITTSSRPVSDAGAGLDPHLAATMTAITLTVPPLRDRSAASRRGAVLAAVAGRPIHPAALRLLEAEPWWGNVVELEGRLAALRALPPGGIDVTTLSAHLPQLAGRSDHAPIRVLLSPTAGPGGRVEGFTREFAAGALLLGRIRRLDELRSLAALGDARAAAWLAVVDAACGPAEPVCLELGPFARLSRAHALITRGEGGLWVRVLPGVGLAVEAGSLEDGRPPRLVAPGSAVPLGRGGELRVLERGSPLTPYLHLFLFLGAVAFEDLAPLALERSRGTRLKAPPTQELSLTAGPGPSAPQAAPPGLAVWPVTAAEEAALTDLLATFSGGQLKAHVARFIEDTPAPAQARLVDYLRRAPRLSQYLVRLYEHPPNVSLRARLRERLAEEPDLGTRLALLPEGLRRIALED